MKRAKEADAVSFTALGGGAEVGRSCHILEYKGKTIMLDAGVHPAFTGLASLPFYDSYDLSTVDVLLISHFHLDHAASLPYVMQRTGFKGRVFMTHPTKAIYRWLLSDFVKVSAGPLEEGNSELYSDEDLNSSFNKIEAVDFYSTTEVGGIKFTAYHAGHVLGAAMYLIEISGLKILFTGDYSREQDRHLHVAEPPPTRPDILICESTYGTGLHQPREEKETKLLSLIHGTIRNGGRCLLPVFALGGTQELMLILEEYWSKHQDLSGVTIYYASSLARKCMAVYQTFINMMNDSIKQQYARTKVNPFQFKHITSLRSLDKFDDIGPCVMLASPGMLQNGVSRQLLERWAPDARNSLIITGYSVEGTMAKHIITEPSSITSSVNPEVKIPRRISVDEISFAAHVDFKQNSEFIDAVGAAHVILVHGEVTNMGRLKSALLSKYAKQKGTHEEVRVYNPRNCVVVRIPFETQTVARTKGGLAAREPNPHERVSGLLVQSHQDFGLSLVNQDDLEALTGLKEARVMEKQRVVVNALPELVRHYLLSMFGTDLADISPTEWVVMQLVTVRFEKANNYSVSWAAGDSSDMLADSILAVLLGVDSSQASVKLTSKQCGDHTHPIPKESESSTDANITEEKKDSNNDVESDSQANLQRGDTRRKQLCSLLVPHFGDTFNATNSTVEIDGHCATIDFDTLHVESTNNTLKNRVQHILDLCASLVEPLSSSL